MDAQNAVEAASTKPSASPKQPAPPPPPESEQSKSAINKSPSAPRPSPPVKDSKAGAPASHTQDEDGGADGQSEAETIVLSGKDKQSPSKPRRQIKHEDKSDGEITADPSGNRKASSGSKESERPDKAGTRNRGGSADGAPSLAGKKKRPQEKHEKQRSKDGSSGLSSAPASPPHHRRQRSSNPHSDSESDAVHAKSPKSSATKDKIRPFADKLVPHKRKAPKADSDDEGESRKVRRQRVSSAGGADVGQTNRASKEHKPSTSKTHNDSHQSSRTRSVSPQLRAHRRSISTQLPSQSNGMSHKKKRIPAPLQSTEYHSDESSASGSPHIRSSKLRSLTTPATTESNVSPAKMAPHKKHLDAHGQTFLARACARGEYDHAKTRLGERPEDLNVADFAGNTPLQIASINGYEDIVKLLVDAGCNLDCVNYDKDTPLLDAVDNGHLEVVRILLDAGVNPRKANVNGEEPIDRVNDELENASEIRAALVDAKKKMGERRHTSEEQHHDQDDGRYSHGPDSPRRSPAGTAAAGSSRRGGTVRSTKTSNHLLYMPMDDKTLRQAAGRGDEETVTRILQVRDTFDDPESMVAAARGGHDLVMQLLLALGSANPDPAPVASMPRELATPMLAAIGQENIKVIKLLLDQTNFDPTRRFQGETYHEIARRRQGTNWKDEEHLLKEAYDAHKKSHKDTSKTKSPARREQDRDSKRVGRPEAKEDALRAHKRKLSSPSRETKKPSSSKLTTSPREKRRSSSLTAHPADQISPKRGPGRPRKDDHLPSIAISDREVSPSAVKRVPKQKRNESDIATMSSEGETVKPRRKLVSGRELKGEREKQQQRRASMVSTTSSMKEPSSPRDSRHDDGPERQKTEKYHDRTRQLKRDESRDAHSVSGESSGKRHRSSATPDHPGAAEKESGEGPPKRRRLDADRQEKKLKIGSSPDDRHRKPSSSRDSIAKLGQKERDEDDRKTSAKPKKREASSDRGRRESGKSITSEKSIHVKSEEIDVEMPDADAATQESESAARTAKEKEDETKKQAEADARVLEAKKKEEEEEQRRHEEEKRKRDQEDAKRKEDEERKRKEEEEKRRKEEEEKEKEKKLREEEEEFKRKEEERKKQEEEEKRRREEEERRQREEEERRLREEEERLRREQLEREAVEAARRKREEEERKEQERKEKLQREEMERRRAAQAERAAREAAEQRRIFEEHERARLAKLPPLLRWFDQCLNPKSPEIAEKFSKMQGVRFDCIRPEATGTADGREQWLLNTQVALLLGEKDLKLSRYTAWEKVAVSMLAKKILWRLEADRYALITPSLYDIGKQLPDYYGGEDPETMSYRIPEKLRGEAWERFAAMEMFFVKASDLMFIVPNIAHLRNLRLTMAYRELPENEAQAMKLKWETTQKWKLDPNPDRFYGFAPRNKYYVNGQFVGEDHPGLAPVSKTPFPEKKVPRRGFLAVSTDDPEYAQLCKEQGLEHLVRDTQSPSLLNGNHSSPLTSTLGRTDTNGQATPSGTSTPTINGSGRHQDTLLAPSISAQVRPSINGINGTGED